MPESHYLVCVLVCLFVSNSKGYHRSATVFHNEACAYFYGKTAELILNELNKDYNQLLGFWSGFAVSVLHEKFLDLLELLDFRRNDRSIFIK